MVILHGLNNAACWSWTSLWLGEGSRSWQISLLLPIDVAVLTGPLMASCNSELLGASVLCLAYMMRPLWQVYWGVHAIRPVAYGCTLQRTCFCETSIASRQQGRAQSIWLSRPAQLHCLDTLSGTSLQHHWRLQCPSSCRSQVEVDSEKPPQLAHR